MRINPALGAVNFLNVTPKAGGVGNDSARADKDGDNGREQYSRQQSSNPEQSQENPAGKDQESFSQNLTKNLDDSIEDIAENFSHDPTPNAIGLSAEAEGKGPGLKVVLKDPNGGVIRHFTGDEFVKLRESLLHETKVRGKILDQKF